MCIIFLKNATLQYGMRLPPQGSTQTVQGITRILVEHTFHNKNLVTISCGSHHVVLQCVVVSSTERGCKHEVQADKTSQVGQAAAANAGQQRYGKRTETPLWTPATRQARARMRHYGNSFWIMRTTARPRRPRPRRSRWKFSGDVGAAPAAVPSHYTTRSRGLRPAKRLAPLTSCGIAGTPQRQKGGLHHDSQH